jgi:hypothetical protein
MLSHFGMELNESFLDCVHVCLVVVLEADDIMAEDCHQMHVDIASRESLVVNQRLTHAHAHLCN